MHMPHLALMNPVALFIIGIMHLLVCMYEHIIAMHPACLASRARIRLPISRIRKLKATLADRITEQVMIALGPKPGVLTPNSSSPEYVNQP